MSETAPEVPADPGPPPAPPATPPATPPSAAAIEVEEITAGAVRMPEPHPPVVPVEEEGDPNVPAPISAEEVSLESQRADEYSSLATDVYDDAGRRIDASGQPVATGLTAPVE